MSPALLLARLVKPRKYIVKMKKTVELVRREVPFQGYFRMAKYWLRHQLFAGGWSDTISREVFERGPAVAVLPYDPKRNEVVLVEQFRAGAFAAGQEAWIIEAIAGMMQSNENGEDVARREAMEEANITFTGPLTRICSYFTSPGACDEYTDVFIGPCDTSQAGGVHGLKDEHEDIRVLVLSFEQALAMIEDRKILGGPAIMGLLWLQANRSKL